MRKIIKIPLAFLSYGVLTTILSTQISAVGHKSNIKQTLTENNYHQVANQVKSKPNVLNWIKEVEKNGFNDYKRDLDNLYQLELTDTQKHFIKNNLREKYQINQFKNKTTKTNIRKRQKRAADKNIRYQKTHYFYEPSRGRSDAVDYRFEDLTHDEAEKIYVRTSGSSSKKYLFKIHDKPIDLSGVTNQINNHHGGFDSIVNLFDSKADTSDITVFNWSNQRILELVLDTLFGNTIIQNKIKSLRKVDEIKHLTNWATDLISSGVAIKIGHIMKNSTFFKGFFNSKAIDLGKNMTKLVNFSNWLKKTTIKTAVKVAGKKPFSIPKSLIEDWKNAKANISKKLYAGIVPTDSSSGSLAKSVGTSIAYSAAALTGPIAPSAIAGVALASFFLNVYPTGNGYSAMSNWGDHGLNDWKFQMEKNFENMVAIAASFSENFIHGVSWKVEDSWFDSPDLWIRPGQSGNEPWMKLSTNYLSTPRGNIKTEKKFVYGTKIEEQGFESITNARNRFRAQKSDGHIIFEELGTIYSNGSPWEDYSKFTIHTPGGVEHSGSNRHYDITWYHLSPSYRIIQKYYPPIKKDHFVTAFQPNMNVHENDNDDDDEIKKWNFKSKIPDGLEIGGYSPGEIVVKFEHEEGRFYTTSEAWTKLLSESYQTAKKWAKDVIGGKNPLKNGERVDLSKYRNNPYMQIVPRYYLHGLDIDRTKFNTYNDPGWDDTHSDKFRHAGISVSFKIVLEARMIN